LTKAGRKPTWHKSAAALHVRLDEKE